MGSFLFPRWLLRNSILTCELSKRIPLLSLTLPCSCVNKRDMVVCNTVLSIVLILHQNCNHALLAEQCSVILPVLSLVRAAHFPSKIYSFVFNNHASLSD